jgi:hypothetical protein
LKEWIFLVGLLIISLSLFGYCTEIVNAPSDYNAAQDDSSSLLIRTIVWGIGSIFISSIIIGALFLFLIIPGFFLGSWTASLTKKMKGKRGASPGLNKGDLIGIALLVCLIIIPLLLFFALIVIYTTNFEPLLSYVISLITFFFLCLILYGIFPYMSFLLGYFAMKNKLWWKFFAGILVIFLTLVIILSSIWFMSNAPYFYADF